MKVSVVVKPNARKESVETLTDGSLRVCVNASPREGLANEAVVRLLAEHFEVAKSSIHIVSGKRGKKKLVEIKI